MTKQELIDTLSDDVGLSKKDAGKAIDTIISTITKALKKGDKVQLVGFGTFEVRKRGAREGRNPQTGASIKIPARKSPAFKPGKALKDALN